MSKFLLTDEYLGNASGLRGKFFLDTRALCWHDGGMTPPIGKGMAAIANAAAKRSNVAKFQTLLEEELGKGLFDDAVVAIREALNSTRNVRTRTPVGIEYVAQPDYPVRLAAAVTVMQYALGKPVNRTEMIVKGEGDQTPQQRAAIAAEALLGDPETLMNVLDDWKEAASQAAGRSKRAQAIDVGGK